ncbi:hypothetical protein [Pseudomonas cremoricolorata]|uniref:Type IV pilus assembly protein PilX n=1 Tax=Pseudomonas cremoricolorata TaxID=157783 RepID=A0A089WNX0_9PSED|nr:hypothetical protein [Pseudomonas cremoricolorata]AIR88147.1 hypothetical protein LK03_02315 [Pseudomonas cremoricolorata]
MSRQRGVVLLISLMLSLLLALLAASALHDALNDTHQAAYLLKGGQAFEQAEATLLEAASLLPAGMPVCKGCPPPIRPHELQGRWQPAASGFYQIQNLGTTERAMHRPRGEQVTLFRVTAVSAQAQSRQVIEAVYALADGEGEVAQRILWRQRSKEE